MSNNYGQGSIGNYPKQRQPGPPFVSTSANNGLSVDPVTGAIVLGNDSLLAFTDAQLLSAREIPLNGFQIFLTDIANNFLITFQNTGIVAVDLTANASRAEMAASPSGSFFALESDSVLANPPEIILTDLAVIPHHIARFRQDGTEFAIAQEGAFHKVLTLDFVTGIYHMGDVDGAANGNREVIDDTLGIHNFENLALNAAYAINGNVGASGSFLSDGAAQTITVQGGIITSIV